MFGYINKELYFYWKTILEKGYISVLMWALITCAYEKSVLPLRPGEAALVMPVDQSVKEAVSEGNCSSQGPNLTMWWS